MDLSLTKEEAEVLHEALEGYLSDLSMEIADTENMDFREKLKRRREVLQALRNRLAEKASGGAGAG